MSVARQVSIEDVYAFLVEEIEHLDAYLETFDNSVEHLSAEDKPYLYVRARSKYLAYVTVLELIDSGQPAKCPD